MTACISKEMLPIKALKLQSVKSVNLKSDEIYKMAFLLYSYALICYRSAIPILRRFVKFQT